VLLIIDLLNKFDRFLGVLSQALLDVAKCLICGIDLSNEELKLAFRLHLELGLDFF